MIIEACVDSLAAALSAEEAGATQIELCSRLDMEGLTPTSDLLSDCLARLKIHIKVMLRPLPGSFEYNAANRPQVQADIQLLTSHGVRDIVYGKTSQSGLDLEDLAYVIEEYDQNGPSLHSITIHKAIDTTADPVREVTRLKHFASEYEGIQFYVLSSGGAGTAIEGADVLNKMKAAGAGVITIIAAGKITSANLTTIQERIPTGAYHGRKIVSNLRMKP